jgi:alpha-galactosidase
LELVHFTVVSDKYANSRRIACDTFGGINETEYMLNSLIYGGWLNRVYDFIDPDHIVLDNHSTGEKRARIPSSAITGIFISGDDFSDTGSAMAKNR